VESCPAFGPHRIVFLREQPDIVAEHQEALEKSVGFIMTARI